MGNPEIKQEISKWGWWLNLCLTRFTPILTGSSQPTCLVTAEPSQDKGACSVQFSCSVVSDSFPPHGPQHARPPCPSPTPGVHPNACPLSCSCHPTISSSVIPFSSCPQSFPASGSFPMRALRIR